MKLVIQRVNQANVQIDNTVIGSINHGLVVLVGFHGEDTHNTIEWVANKILQLRIFTDKEGKMNESVIDIQGEILVVSQFTLYGMVKKGTRPSFIEAAKPEQAEVLYNYFLDYLKKQSQVPIESGKFGGDMKVSLINDGPVTIIIEK